MTEPPCPNPNFPLFPFQLSFELYCSCSFYVMGSSCNYANSIYSVAWEMALKNKPSKCSCHIDPTVSTKTMYGLLTLSSRGTQDIPS